MLVDIGAVDLDRAAGTFGSIERQRVEQALEHRREAPRTDVLLALVHRMRDLGEPLQLVLHEGVPQDSPARRDAAERERAEVSSARLAGGASVRGRLVDKQGAPRPDVALQLRDWSSAEEFEVFEGWPRERSVGGDPARPSWRITST
mgnify:CR=1 FL=1